METFFKLRITLHKRKKERRKKVYLYSHFTSKLKAMPSKGNLRETDGGEPCLQTSRKSSHAAKKRKKKNKVVNTPFTFLQRDTLTRFYLSERRTPEGSWESQVSKHKLAAPKRPSPLTCSLSSIRAELVSTGQRPRRGPLHSPAVCIQSPALWCHSPSPLTHSSPAAWRVTRTLVSRHHAASEGARRAPRKRAGDVCPPALAVASW